MALCGKSLGPGCEAGKTRALDGRRAGSLHAAQRGPGLVGRLSGFCRNPSLLWFSLGADGLPGARVLAGLSTPTGPSQAGRMNDEGCKLVAAEILQEALSQISHSKNEVKVMC